MGLVGLVERAGQLEPCIWPSGTDPFLMQPVMELSSSCPTLPACVDSALISNHEAIRPSQPGAQARSGKERGGKNYVVVVTVDVDNMLPRVALRGVF